MPSRSHHQPRNGLFCEWQDGINGSFSFPPTTPTPTREEPFHSLKPIKKIFSLPGKDQLFKIVILTQNKTSNQDKPIINQPITASYLLLLHSLSESDPGKWWNLAQIATLNTGTEKHFCTARTDTLRIKISLFFLPLHTVRLCHAHTLCLLFWWWRLACADCMSSSSSSIYFYF